MPKIMIVDDEPDFVHIVKTMLEQEGYEVIEANSGKECLDKLKQEKPDLILLDVMMPEIDGYDVCRIIKEDEETHSITIAMLTVKTGDEDKIRSLEESHADWHISKPIDREKLISTVKWLLESPPRRSLEE